MLERRRAVVLLYLRTGSRFESSRENGLSHFVEHMLFRGTEEHPSAYELARAFEELGGTLDASTAADHGTLGIAVPPENLAEVLPLLAEVYRRPIFSDIDLERGIITEEIHEELNEDQKWIDPATLARSSAFSGSSLGQPIIGSLSNVEHFDLAQIRSHHDRTYVGQDLVISIAGPFAPSVVERHIESVFSSLPRGEKLTSRSPDDQSAPRFVHVHQPGTSQTRLSLSFRCPSNQHSLEPAVDLLMRIIDDGMSTRLYHRLCDQRGLCYSVGGSYEAYNDVGLLELEADTAHDKAMAVVEQMKVLCEELTLDLVSDREFERARKRARWQHEVLLDDPGDVADFLAMAELTNTARTPEARLEEIMAVTKQDVREAARAIFRKEGRNLIAVGTSRAATKTGLERLALS